jgi:hypothetical protein
MIRCEFQTVVQQVTGTAGLKVLRRAQCTPWLGDLKLDKALALTHWEQVWGREKVFGTV